MDDGPRITAITPTKRDPLRTVVRVGGRAAATLSLDAVDELALSVGRPWNGELADRVERAAAFDKALRSGLGHLNRRAMSTHELERKLAETGHGEAARDRVIKRLTDLGLLDDEAYGQALMRELTHGRAAGVRLLRQKLAQRGLDRDLIDRLLAESVDTDDERERAIEFARSKLRSASGLDPLARRRRLYGQLARRGYESEVIDDVLNAVAHEIGSDEADW